MAVAFVQSDIFNVVANTTMHLSFPSAGAGNLIVVAVAINDTTVSLSSLKDDLGNNLTLTPGSPQVNTGFWKMWIGYLPNVTAGSRTVTTIISSAANIFMFGHEVSGAATTSPLDDDAGQNAAGADGAHITFPSLVTTQAGDYLFGAAIAPNITSAANGWTLTGLRSGNADERQIATGAGTYPLDFTSTITGNWVLMGAAFSVPSTVTPKTSQRVGIFSKDAVLAVGTFDVGIPIAYGLFDDDFVAQFSGTVYNPNASQQASVPWGVFSKDATLDGLFDD